MNKTKKKQTRFSIDTNIRIQGLDEAPGVDFDKLPANETFTLAIDYPLSVKAAFPLKTGKNGMGLPRLLQEIGKAYREVYENDEKYGIWGHGIGDLWLEGINIDLEKKTVRLSVGS